jgi:PNKP adenylyltransferase domain, ligase domain
MLDEPFVEMDAELLPWSAKAEDLRRQYAAVGPEYTDPVCSVRSVGN